VIVSSLAALERRDPPPAALPAAPERDAPDPSRPRSDRQRARELAVAELRAVAPAGHSFGRRGR
jgi:hypothetical protein